MAARAPVEVAYEVAPPGIDLSVYRSSLVVYVNGARVDVPARESDVLLLDFLRARGLTGAKLGCGEGGCGACTVVISRHDAATGEARHTSVNACLMPLLAADGCDVTTVEGIGSTRTELHPVQQRMAEMHGAQCGFCTPGIVMAMYALFLNNPKAPVELIEESMDGNLCRCTGYRPIWDAAKSLCADAHREPAGAEAATQAERCVTCPHKDAAGQNGACSHAHAHDGGAGAGAGAGAGEIEACAMHARAAVRSVVSSTANKLAEMHAATPYHATKAAERDAARARLPPELAAPLGPLRVNAGRLVWWRPRALADALNLKAAFPHARVVVGNTEVGIEARFKGQAPAVVIATQDVPELRDAVFTERGLELGASAPLSSVAELCERCAHASAVCEAAAQMLRWFASNQIRNVACLGGNLATASPISDMNPLLAAAGATLEIASAARGARLVPVRGFFKAYRTVDLAPDELIVRVHVPHAAPRFEYIVPYKQARRREDDISIVTATLRARFEPTADGWVCADAALAFGGLAPTTVLARQAAASLVGERWCDATFERAAAALAREVRVPDGAPGGQAEYRGALATSFLFKFFVHTSLRLGEAKAEADASAARALAEGAAPTRAPLPAAPLIAAAERTAARSWVTEPKPATSGTQTYAERLRPLPGLEQDKYPDAAAPSHAANGNANGHGNGTAAAAAAAAPKSGQSGQSVPHAAANLHVTGEATYVDDIPQPSGLLHAALVGSQRAAARIVAVDATAARAMRGVVRILFHADLPGKNDLGPVVHDEECFAEAVVHSVGQVIGIVVATSVREAREAAAAVRVEYEELDQFDGGSTEGRPIISIDDAIRAGSFYAVTDHTLESGPAVEPLLATAGAIVVEGEFRLGGQEHFYLESNTTLAVPTEGGGLALHTSTQAVAKTQNLVAHVCAIPAHKVVCHMRRMGGGFGGKETRSVPFSCAVAVAAHLLRVPVRLSLERDVDMQISGQRHAFLAKYRAAVLPASSAAADGSTPPPKLLALDVQLFSNGGCALDLSGPVMDRAIFHLDSCYKWPALRVRGRVCRTHQAPHTAFRGFGGPQGMMVAEAIMEHLACAAHADPVAFRSANLYAQGDETHFGQKLELWNVPAAWEQLQQSAELAQRRAAVSRFNGEHSWRKRGIAIVPTKFGINFTAKFMNQGGALVHVYTDGTVLVSHGGTEMGQGLHTKVCQIVAHALDVPLSDVHIAETASDKVANSMPTAASMSNDLYAMAALDACEQILKRLAPVRKSLPPGAPLKAVAAKANFERVDLSAHGFFAVDDARCGYDWALEPPPRKPDGTPDNARRGLPFNYFTQGVAIAEVELDVLTGDHAVLRADLLVDVGSTINAPLDVGQIEGAFAQGVGLCTIEEVVWADDEHSWVQPRGRLLTRGPGAYKLPSFNDVPRDLRVGLMQRVANPFAVHSSKAVGEPPLFLGFSVFMALRDAVRAARVEHLGASAHAHFTLHSPATSERLRMACADRFARMAVELNGRGDVGSYVPKGSF